MSRRFTLFALLTAACLLFASCGGLFTSSSTEITFGKTKSDTKPVASTTTSIRIPLPSRTQRTVMDPSAPNTPLELCDSYKFTLKSTDDEYSAAADADDQFIEFPEVEYGTYTITATAYGKLGDGKTTAIANYSKSNIVVDKASVTITVKFTLTENAKIYLYGYTGTPVTNADGSTTQPTYAGKDGKTLLSEKTTSSDGRTETEISYAVDLETGENTTDAQGNPVVTKTVVKETQTSGDEKVTTTEFSLNETEEGCSKRITIEEGTKTTVKKYDDNSSDESQPTSMEVTEKLENSTTISTYDNGDWDHPASITVIENTQKTTTTYDESGKESATLDTIIIEITAGQNAGQKTIQKYATAAAGNPKTEETVISAVGTAVVSSEYDTVGGTVSAQKETYYAAGYDYEHPDSNANALLKNKEIEYTVSGGARTGKTETTFNYTAGLTTAKEYDGTTGIVPVAKTVKNVYSLSEGNATLTETITTENVFTSGVKSKTIVTETTVGQEANTKTTTTEYNLNQTNCDMRVTVAQGNTTTVSRYAENPANPATATLVEKDVTTVTGGVETTKYFTGEDMTKPSMKVEKESTRTTTTEYVAGSEKTNKVTEIITAGENAGQKTETEYDTSGASSVKTIETVTSPDNHKTISTFDFSTANTEKKTTYQTDWDPDTGTEANPNNYHVAKTIEQAFNADGTVKSTTTSEFDYTDTALNIIHYDQYNNPVIPYDSTEVTVEENGSTITTKTIYTYCDGDVKSTNPLGRQASKTIEVTDNGVTTTTTETYTYDDKGRIIKEESTAPGYVTKEWGYEQKSIVVYERTSGTDHQTYVTANAKPIFTIPKNDENAMRVAKNATVTEAVVLQFLTNNYVLCGDTEADLNWVRTDEKGDDTTTYLRSRTIKGASKDGLYQYIYKVNHSKFAAPENEGGHSGCMSVTVVGDTAYVIVHNDKNGCTNFWNSLDTWKYKEPETGTVVNYGAAGTGSGVGGN